jgi:hypothetical protein
MGCAADTYNITQSKVDPKLQLPPELTCDKCGKSCEVLIGVKVIGWYNHKPEIEYWCRSCVEYEPE